MGNCFSGKNKTIVSTLAKKKSAPNENKSDFFYFSEWLKNFKYYNKIEEERTTKLITSIEDPHDINIYQLIKAVDQLSDKNLNEYNLYKKLWEVDDPIVCICEDDGSENMRVLLVKSIPEVRNVFGKITSLSELGTSYFNTHLVRSDRMIDMATDWGIIDLKVNSFEEKLMEVSKYMDISIVQSLSKDI